MKKHFILLFLFLSFILFAQNEQKESVVSKLEDPLNFRLNFLREYVNPVLVRLQNTNDTNKENNFVLGLKYETLKSNANINLFAEQSIEIPGIIKSISLWVDGRKNKTRVLLIVQDAGGYIKRIPFKTEDGSEELNYLGWKKLTATIDEKFLQKDRAYDSSLQKVKFLGIQIRPEYKRNRANQYVYLSDLKASVEQAEEATTYSDNW